MPPHLCTAYLLAFLCTSLTLLTLPPASAAIDEDVKTLSKVEQLGGRVDESHGFLEIDFHLKGKALNDTGLAHLASLEKLKWLHLGGTQVTGEGLHHLRALHHLEALHLENTSVGDKGISDLIDLPKLRYLNLYGTQITDRGLLELANSESLERIYVWKTRVTPEGIAKLRDENPNIRISTGLRLDALASTFPEAIEDKPPTRKLVWHPCRNRTEAPVKSDNGVNCQVWFKNETDTTLKLYWISFGDGELKFYADLTPGKLRQQNTYARNAWLITNTEDQPLGYFVADEDHALAIIPSSVSSD
ncbi:MAG: hypothetical protein VXX55_06950 [Planctomycetota bacterium]|nr:hypothetical protein [Planctomycetota bacterium]MEC8800481.1 hypothetical protein [Planctomycetota bacterium]